MVKNENINIEYEARAMITEEQYFEIMDFFSKVKKEKKYIRNVNTYFDYEDLFLTNHQVVIRTRSIDDKEYELTLKIKGESGDTEYNLQLSKNEYDKINETAQILEGNIKDKLLEYKVDLSKLKRITTLSTIRLEVYYKKYTLVIDKNEYDDKTDYNVEVESYSKTAAKMHLNKSFSRFGVSYKKGYISKSRRAIFKL